MLKNGERRQFNLTCPFDCTNWDECVCENTAIRDGTETLEGKVFFNADEVRGLQVAGVRAAIYETYRDRNPTLETAETGPQWSLEPDYRQDDFTAMAEAAVDAMMDRDRRL